MLNGFLFLLLYDFNFEENSRVSDAEASTSSGGVRQPNEAFQRILKDRKLREGVTNRTPHDFFFIKVLGEGAFSTV